MPLYDLSIFYIKNAGSLKYRFTKTLIHTNPPGLPDLLPGNGADVCVGKKVKTDSSYFSITDPAAA